MLLPNDSYPTDARGTFSDTIRLQLSFKVQAAFLAAITIIILLIVIVVSIPTFRCIDTPSETHPFSSIDSAARPTTHP